MDEKQTRRKNMEQKRRKWKEDKQKMVAVLFDRESMEISTDVMPLLKLNQLSATFLHLLLLLSFQTWAIERTMRGRRERDSFRECDYRTPWKSITLYQFFLKGFQWWRLLRKFLGQVLGRLRLYSSHHRYLQNFSSFFCLLSRPFKKPLSFSFIFPFYTIVKNLVVNELLKLTS